MNQTDPTAARYRKKPIAYEAHQWQPADAESTGRLIGVLTAHGVHHQCTASTGARTAITIRTLEGDMTAQPGDWIIIGHKPGEAWPVRGDIFAETYEPAASAVVAPPTDQAAIRAQAFRDAEEICDEAGAVYTAKARNGEATGAYDLMERFRRKAEEAEETAVEAHGTGTQQPERCPALFDQFSADHEMRRLDPEGPEQCAYCGKPGQPAPVAQQPAAEAPTDRAAVQRVRESLAELRDRGATGMQYYDRILADRNSRSEQQAATADGEETPKVCGCGHMRGIHVGGNQFCAVPGCECARYSSPRTP